MSVTNVSRTRPIPTPVVMRMTHQALPSGPRLQKSCLSEMERRSGKTRISAARVPLRTTFQTSPCSRSSPGGGQRTTDALAPIADVPCVSAFSLDWSIASLFAGNDRPTNTGTKWGKSKGITTTDHSVSVRVVRILYLAISRYRIGRLLRPRPSLPGAPPERSALFGRAGFTLLELMLVTVIVAALASIVANRVRGVMVKAHIN